MSKFPFIAIVTSLLFLSRIGEAQVPGIINYQGRVAVGGANFNGTGQFQFALVNGAGNISYWSNDGSSAGGAQPTLAVSLTVTKGLYSVLLGDTTIGNMTVAIPATTFTNSDVRLRVWFNDGASGFQRLSPDQRIAAAGYSFMAASIPAGAVTVSATPTNYDVIVFRSLVNLTTNDFVGGVVYGTDLDSTDGVTNQLYSVAQTSQPSTQNAYAFAKIMVPQSQTNLSAIGMDFKRNQDGANQVNFVIRVSSALQGASTVFTAVVSALNANYSTNFPTSGTFLTNNLSGQRLDFRWEISISSSNSVSTAEKGIGMDFRWIQQ